MTVTSPSFPCDGSRFVLQIFSGIFYASRPELEPLCALHSPPLREPDSPLASREHLALHNLSKHLEAPLQFTGAHVTGEISNVHHAAFTLPEGDTEGPVIIAWLPGAPLVAGSHGVLVPSPHHLAKRVTPGGAAVREDNDGRYPRGPAL